MLTLPPPCVQLLAVSFPLSTAIPFPVFFAFLRCGPGDAALALQWEGCAFSNLLFPCRMFVAQQIVSSNLLLLVTDAVCDCSIFPPVLMDVKEVKYILPYVCSGGAELHRSLHLHVC